MLFSIPFGITTQAQSTSNNSNGILSVEPINPYSPNTTLDSSTNLIWEADSGALTNSGANVTFNIGSTNVTTNTEVFQRKWKFIEIFSDTGIVRVSLPTAKLTNGFPSANPTDAYVMVVSNNTSFTNGVETIFMSTLGNNQSCFYNFEGIKYVTFGIAHQTVNRLQLSLDGYDDFIKINNVNEIGAAFSIMTWIRPNGANSYENERTILAKKATASSGYQLVLQTNNKIRMEWSVDGVTYSAISNTSLPNLKWHNIAITYGANALSIYIDGVLDKTATITTNPIASSSNFCIGGQYTNQSTITNLFKGNIDELRMWNVKISTDQIRFIMNQEIIQNNLGTKGTILPSTVTKNEINNLNWNNLFAYYSMNSYIGTSLDDDSSNNNRGSIMMSDKISINSQTAPLPYKSTTDGLWSSNSSWINGNFQDIPNSISIVDNQTSLNWNIVMINHNVESTGNKNLLGLIVESNNLSIKNNSKLVISHYLKLNGKIDLVEKSQLIQTLNSDLDPTSTGSIERDQQGQSSVFNYNYWSSPVGAINTTSNNNAFTLASVMKDGTTNIPQNINWISGYNGSATSPISICNFWIYKFQNTSGTYANWQALGSSGLLNPGQGYTMKGSGTSSLNQNYTFVGKPNNGLITRVIGPNNLNLIGNPYSSALDIDSFISANSNSITGTLYFWEQFSTNTSHNSIAYQGGYSQRNKVGGTPAMVHPVLSGLGSKVPKKYIPVGQGFFISGSSTGGNITFNNDQRAFFKEDNSNLSNSLFRNTSANQNILSVDHFNDNSEDEQPAIANNKKIRLGFSDRNGYHRQILMGFMDEYATSGIDQGYDAVHLDNQPNDMYFLNGTTKINIAGEGFFNVNAVYPIGVKIDALGTVTFKIDNLENFEDTFQAFIYDNQTNIYHTINAGDFSIELPQGTFNNRFSLRFINGNALSTSNFNLSDGIIVAYTSANDMLNIKNNLTDATVEKVTLFNLLGQSISDWNIENDNQQNIQLPIKTVNTGTYIVKIKTDKGEISKKIMIN